MMNQSHILHRVFKTKSLKKSEILRQQNAQQIPAGFCNNVVITNENNSQSKDIDVTHDTDINITFLF